MYAVTCVLYARIEPKQLIIKDNNECVLSVGGLATTGFLRGQVYPDTVVLAARHGLVQVDSLEVVVTWRPISYV